MIINVKDEIKRGKLRKSVGTTNINLEGYEVERPLSDFIEKLNDITRTMIDKGADKVLFRIPDVGDQECSYCYITIEGVKDETDKEFKLRIQEIKKFNNQERKAIKDNALQRKQNELARAAKLLKENGFKVIK